MEAFYRVDGAAVLDPGRVLDLAPGGLLLEAERALEPGTGIVVSMLSPDRRELMAAARVVRCGPSGEGRFTMGCRFD